MIDRKKAQDIILAAATPQPSETVPLEKAAGRVLREAAVADRDQPPCDNSAMDGFALRAADATEPGAELRILGDILAGDPSPGRPAGRGEAYRIMTGAPMPPGADTVVMVEHTEAAGEGRVRLGRAAEAGRHIRRRGEARRAGEELVAAGTTLGPAEIGLLASVGLARVPVGRRPRVAVLSTGDEIVPVESDPLPHQLRNGNGPMLAARAVAAGASVGPPLWSGDALDDLRAATRAGLEAEILVATGGVSMGEADRVGQAFAAEGVEQVFHRVAVKPGKPLWFGRRGETLVFGLPGNPVSCLVGFLLFVEPALRRMAGCGRPHPPTVRARLTAALRSLREREAYHPVALEPGEGGWRAAPVPSTGSADLASLAVADALAITPAGGPSPGAGDPVEILLLPGPDGPAR
jgi:molybdopterin molybdotransferase